MIDRFHLLRRWPPHRFLGEIRDSRERFRSGAGKKNEKMFPILKEDRRKERPRFSIIKEEASLEFQLWKREKFLKEIFESIFRRRWNLGLN